MKEKIMQFALITLTLSSVGDVPTSTVEKRITPSESTLLKSIHGVGCIRNIRLVKEEDKTEKEKKVDIKKDFDRLVHNYGISKLQKVWPQISEEIIPFSINFKDVGITKEVIKKSHLGVGAIQTSVDEDAVKECLENKLITKEIIIEALKLLPEEEVEEVKATIDDTSHKLTIKIKDLEATVKKEKLELEKAKFDLETAKEEIVRVKKKNPPAQVGDGMGGL